MGKTLLEFKNLVTEFHTEGKTVKAVNNISFTLNQGETIGIVGESGSGKTSLVLAILKLISSKGNIFFNKQDINKINNKQMKILR